MSAATVMGCSLADQDDDVELLVPKGAVFGPYDGVSIKRLTVPVPGGPTKKELRLTSLSRVAFDLAARRPLVDGVAYLDAFARKGFIEPSEFRRWLADQHCQDVVAVRAAAELMDVRAPSPQESRMRVHLVLAGLHLEPQYEVRVRGRLVARVDLADVERKVALEYDGAWHALREQLERDRERLNALREAGWSVVHVTASMLRRPEELVARVREALSRPSG